MATLWWVKSGTGGDDSGSSWANAAESIPGLMAAQAIAGDTIIYVHNTHNYQAGAAIAWTLPESGTGKVQVICVDGGDPTGASLVDGTVGNVTTGAVESTNGNFDFWIATTSSENAMLFAQGMTIKTGSGGSESSADLSIGGAKGLHVFENCTFWTNSTNTGALPTLGAAGAIIEFNNCLFKFGVSGQRIDASSTVLRMRGCSIDSSLYPTTLFATTAGRTQSVECYDCDFSAPTNVVSRASNGSVWKFYNCAIQTPVTGTSSGLAQPYFEFQSCAGVDGTNGADILSYYYEDAFGDVQDSQTIYLTTGGAQGEQDDGTDTPYSLCMTPSAYVAADSPLWTPWIHKFVDSTGDKTITIKVAHTESVVLKENEVFGQISCMGEPGLTGTQRVANSPHGQVEYDDAVHLASSSLCIDPTVTGDNRTDTSEAWTGIASEKTHTLTFSVNCAEVGYIAVRVGLAKDTTNPVYVDPKIGVA